MRKVMATEEKARRERNFARAPPILALQRRPVPW